MAKERKKDTVKLSLLEAEVVEQPITETIETNYMPYVMSVIISRAIPSIDGFKPAHRKLLYTMYKMGLLTGQRTKSANVVGQTMRLNPHGDAAIYETMVRLTRGNEALLHPFVDSKGSFGKQYSRDMAYAASRYTEVKLDPFAAELFEGIDRNAVDMVPNYDNTMEEPSLLPTTFPNILVSPNLGIAVGMACSICSFNLGEVCDATIALLRNPETTVEKIMGLLKAPDFPGGGQIIYDKESMRQIYETGSGSVRIRARYSYDKKQNAIDILQIPYSTSIESIMKKITELVKDGKIRSIVDIRDAIDLNGFKLTIDLRKDTDPDKLMAKLYMLTTLEDTFDCNFNILVNNAPRQMGVVDILKNWISFRMDCLRREFSFTLGKKEAKLHLLLGLAAILLDIDKAIRIIRSTEKESDVIPRLMDAFALSEKQAEYIAEIKLRHLNREYILNRITEIEDLQKEIADLDSTIKDDLKIKTVIAEQLRDIKKKYGKARKTQLINASEIEELDPEDLIDSYVVTATLTKEGYFKKLLRLTGKAAEEMKLKDGDELLSSVSADNSHEYWVFTNKNNLYRFKLNDFEISKPSQLGEYLPAKCRMDEDEEIAFATSVNPSVKKLLFVYQNGKSVIMPQKAFEPTKRNKVTQAVAAIPVAIIPCDENKDVLFLSSQQKALIVNTSKISKVAGKGAVGVSVMSLKGGALLSLATDKLDAYPDIPIKAKKDSIPSSGVAYAEN